jgi:hypothetical protein
MVAVGAWMKRWSKTYGFKQGLRAWPVRIELELVEDPARDQDRPIEMTKKWEEVGPPHRDERPGIRDDGVGQRAISSSSVRSSGE